MGPFGIQEMIFIFVLALLIFGPKKLPELGRSFGKGMAEFKRASNELRSTFQREMDAIESETKEVKNTANEINKDVKASYYDDKTEDYYSDYQSPKITPASHGSIPDAAKTEIAASAAEQVHNNNGWTGETSSSKA